MFFTFELVKKGQGVEKDQVVANRRAWFSVLFLQTFHRITCCALYAWFDNVLGENGIAFVGCHVHQNTTAVKRLQPWQTRRYREIMTSRPCRPTPRNRQFRCVDYAAGSPLLPLSIPCAALFLLHTLDKVRKKSDHGSRASERERERTSKRNSKWDQFQKQRKKRVVQHRLDTHSTWLKLRKAKRRWKERNEARLKRWIYPNRLIMPLNG